MNRNEKLIEATKRFPKGELFSLLFMAFGLGVIFFAGLLAFLEVV